MQVSFTQAEIADLLHIAQSTVSRRLREARNQRNLQYKLIAQVAAVIVLGACLLVLTAAVATIAWRLPGPMRIRP